MKNEFEEYDSYECDWCGRSVDSEDDLTLFEYYSIPSNCTPETALLCENCLEYDYDFIVCEECGRNIAETNGMRRNIRDYHGEILCYECLQNRWFKEGMREDDFNDNPANLKIDGDWCSYRELEQNGFEKIDNYNDICGSIGVLNCAKKALKLINEGHKVIVSIDSSGMGLEYHFSLWCKKTTEEK